VARVWVVNASPLILLGRIGRLDLLPRLSNQLMIPHAVMREVQEGQEQDPARVWVQGTGRQFLCPSVPADPDVASWDLGPGETEVLSLCRAATEREAIIDDDAARRCAIALGVPVRGTLGVIVLAKHKGIIPAARPVVEELTANGLRAKPEVVQLAIRLAGE